MFDRVPCKDNSRSFPVGLDVEADKVKQTTFTSCLFLSSFIAVRYSTYKAIIEYAYVFNVYNVRKEVTGHFNQMPTEAACPVHFSNNNNQTGDLINASMTCAKLDLLIVFHVMLHMLVAVSL